MAYFFCNSSIIILPNVLDLLYYYHNTYESKYKTKSFMLCDLFIEHSSRPSHILIASGLWRFIALYKLKKS